MDSTPELAAKLDRDRREAWERMSFAERFLAGPALFDAGIMMMRAGIRMQHPDADDAQVEQIVRERLRMARCIENRQ